MKELFRAFIETLYVLLPAILANMLPVVVGGGRAVSTKLFGAGKTWRGLLLSPLMATLLMLGCAFTSARWGWSSVYDPSELGTTIIMSLAIGYGGLIGDLTKSYFKRRRGIPRGEQWPIYDQLDFVVGGLMGAFVASTLLQSVGYTSQNWAIQNLRWYGIIAVLVTMPILHRLVNIVGYRLGLKKVPW